MGGGVDHYRSFFYPPAASFLHGKLILVFGSGERHDLGYPGDASKDENNRLYVISDAHPTGTGAFSSTFSEADLTDVTNTDTDGDASDAGYYFTLADSEKFVTDPMIFAGTLVVASYTPIPSSDLCATASGQGFLYPVDLASGRSSRWIGAGELESPAFHVSGPSRASWVPSRARIPKC